jgi:hypothetical protein
MEEVSKVHIGLDVHKNSITVGVAEAGRAPARVISKIPHDVNKLMKLLVKVGQEQRLHIVYEESARQKASGKSVTHQPGLRKFSLSRKRERENTGGVRALGSAAQTPQDL